jgi:hypothetical protein
MSTADARTMSQSYRIVHLTGCVLGTVLIALSVVFAIGAGPPPLNAGMIALIIVAGGFVLAWRSDVLGGLISLVGIASFYVWNLAGTGDFPGGWVFPLCFLPGALQIIAWILRST